MSILLSTTVCMQVQMIQSVVMVYALQCMHIPSAVSLYALHLCRQRIVHNVLHRLSQHGVLNDRQHIARIKLTNTVHRACSYPLSGLLVLKMLTVVCRCLPQGKWLYHRGRTSRHWMKCWRFSRGLSPQRDQPFITPMQLPCPPPAAAAEVLVLSQLVYLYATFLQHVGHAHNGMTWLAGASHGLSLPHL